VYFHPQFRRRFDALVAAAAKAERVGRSDHPDVKLLAAVVRLVEMIVPADPDHPDFRLRGDLGRFRRAKGRGLPSRYRLLWVFSSRARAIVFLYLNDASSLRKAGAKSDPYAQFADLLRRGELAPNFDSNIVAAKRPPRSGT
jgi:toxin YhaV